MTTASQSPHSPPSAARGDGEPRHWTCEEFHCAHDLGLFQPEERLELVRGQIYYRDHPGQPRRWTREEYYRAADLGLFDAEERLELIRGEVIQKVSPQKRPHARSIYGGAKALEAAFGPGFHVLQQSPLAITDGDEPEPDLMVVVGALDDYADHPTPADVRLVVEVSDTTLRMDRNTKAALYAEAGLAEYWISNLRVRRLEIYRDPVPLAEPPGGYGYRSVTFYSEEDSVTSLAAPDAVIRVADLLPPELPAKDPGEENPVGKG